MRLESKLCAIWTEQEGGKKAFLMKDFRVSLKRAGSWSHSDGSRQSNFIISTWWPGPVPAGTAGTRPETASPPGRGGGRPAACQPFNPSPGSRSVPVPGRGTRTQLRCLFIASGQEGRPQLAWTELACRARRDWRDTQIRRGCLLSLGHACGPRGFDVPEGVWTVPLFPTHPAVIEGNVQVNGAFGALLIPGGRSRPPLPWTRALAASLLLHTTPSSSTSSRPHSPVPALPGQWQRADVGPSEPAALHATRY